MLVKCVYYILLVFLDYSGPYPVISVNCVGHSELCLATAILVMTFLQNSLPISYVTAFLKTSQVHSTILLTKVVVLKSIYQKIGHIMDIQSFASLFLEPRPES